MTDPATTPRVALYARVSTSDQSTEIQVRDLRTYAERQGWTVPTELAFVDEGVSGTKDSRPALDRLRRAVFAGQVDVLLVTAPDRLGRNVVAGLLLVQELAARGVRLVILSLGLDTSSPTGRMALTVMLAFAEWERTLILGRTKAGIARAREKGVRFGRPPDTPSEVVREIVRLRDVERQSWREISETVRVKVSRVRRAYAVSKATPKMASPTDPEGGSLSKAPSTESGGSFDTAPGGVPAGGDPSPGRKSRL
ncbi:MAG: recombinase family protein [Thermoplasmata archaeon]